jgi:uncharacterized OsmC-like protein
MHSVGFREIRIQAQADLLQANPLRLVNIKAKVYTDANLEDKREVFLRFIKNCPIHNTIIHTKEIDIDLANP